MDAWMLTDNRPETTSEGRHWVAEDWGWIATRRPYVGEAEGDWEYINRFADF